MRKPVYASEARFELKLPGALKEEVQRKAASEGRMVSDVIRELLQVYIGREIPARVYHKGGDPARVKRAL